MYDFHLGLPEVKNHPILDGHIHFAGNVMAFGNEKIAPFPEGFRRHISVTVRQGFHVCKMPGVERVSAEGGFREKIVEDQVVLMGMGGDQKINMPLVLERT
jgi:hypothetical protein